MPFSARPAPLATILLVLACGGRAAGTPPAAPEPPSDAGVALVPTTGVVIRDSDAGPTPGPDATAEPVPQATAQAPATPTPAEDTICQRHYDELMAPPARSHPPIDCERVDRLVYWRWSASDGCRDVARLSLRRSGAATLERSGGDPAVPARKTIDPSESATVLQATCRAFDEEHDPGAGSDCPAGSRLVELFEGEAKAGSTGALPCGSRTMAGVLDRLDRLLDRF